MKTATTPYEEIEAQRDRDAIAYKAIADAVSGAVAGVVTSIASNLVVERIPVFIGKMAEVAAVAIDHGFRAYDARRAKEAE